MMTTVAATLAELLSSAPDPLLAADRIGARRPSTSSNVPAISIGVEIEDGGARWTTDSRGQGLSGTVVLEIWAMTAGEAESLAQKFERRLRDLRSRFRERGFLHLRAHALHPGEVVSYQPLVGSPFNVYRLVCSFGFVFQAPPVEDVVEGGPIKTIDVRLQPPTSEELIVP